MGKFIDLTGQRFGRLTVVERAKSYVDANGRTKDAQWICKCDCGNITHPIRNCQLRSGNTKSCGCLSSRLSISKINTTHGMSKTRLYRIWKAMKDRCYRSNNSQYKYYGGRGIVVCDEWLRDFQTFHDWAMANGYEEHLTIDRKNNNGNYEPDNCRWITNALQQSNKNNCQMLNHNGKTQTLTEWARELGINRGTLWSRINTLHWEVEKALAYQRLYVNNKDGG